MARAPAPGTGFKRFEKVVADVNLLGVPAGTPGKVLLVDGLSWERYRVLFANGVDRGSLDHRHLVRPREFVPLDRRTARVDTGEAGAADSTGGEAEASEAAGADNASGVPAHLLERSRAARARLGGT